MANVLKGPERFIKYPDISFGKLLFDKINKYERNYALVSKFFISICTVDYRYVSKTYLFTYY
jgi:hypothetical protein